jgi:outer membrane protein assembly factor BamD
MSSLSHPLRSCLRTFGAVLPAWALVSLLVASCSAPPPPPEDELFREASLALEDESYKAAIESYKKLLEEYPFSDKAEIASLNIAYGHYLTGDYIEAIGAFNDFERLYPVSPLLPFVSYTIGMCWLDEAKSGDRDPSSSKEALRQFQKVESEYPRTLYADLARYRQQQARENLSSHEIAIGDYYRERKRFAAAAGRYSMVLRVYPTTENAARATERLAAIQDQVAEDLAKKAAKPAPTTGDMKAAEGS